jgi:hypothetical protein
MTKIQELQTVLGVEADDKWGPKSQAAFDLVVHPPAPAGTSGRRKAKASSFADDADLEAFAKCKRHGGYQSAGEWHPGSSDEHCFNIGDNGVGAWKEATVAGSGPCVAITASELRDRWGSTGNGHGKKVRVFYNEKTAVFPVKDLLGTPGRVDLNPDAAAELGLTPPFLEPIEWEWA